MFTGLQSKEHIGILFYEPTVCKSIRSISSFAIIYIDTDSTYIGIKNEKSIFFDISGSALVPGS